MLPMQAPLKRYGMILYEIWPLVIIRVFDQTDFYSVIFRVIKPWDFLTIKMKSCRQSSSRMTGSCYSKSMSTWVRVTEWLVSLQLGPHLHPSENKSSVRCQDTPQSLVRCQDTPQFPLFCRCECANPILL